MEVEPREGNAAEAPPEDGGQTDGDKKTWYPYITKTQFEKFLSRLQGKMPEEINRDYVRAIIRTPSMIYRFLRGIEAMQLIDAEQHPAERLSELVAPDTRRHTMGLIIKDLYPTLWENWSQADGKMPDRDIAAFFRKDTGMGNDSANKMKMFFKYLLSESDLDGEPPPAEADDEPSEDQEAAAPATAPAAQPAAQPAAKPQQARPQQAAPAAQSRRAPQPRTPRRDSGGQADRADRADRAERTERTERTERAETPERVDRSSNTRVLSEAQRAYLDTLKSVLQVKIDGDWDDDMIKLAFDRLERLFDRIRRG